MKKPVAALLLSAAALVAVAAPAGAAVPSRPADRTLPCNDGSGKSAQLWSNRPGQLAAKNPCRSLWLILPYGSQYYNSSYDSSLAVVPGAHFNWNKKQVAAYVGPDTPPGWGQLRDAACSGLSEGNVSLVYSYKDVRHDGDCS